MAESTSCPASQVGLKHAALAQPHTALLLVSDALDVTERDVGSGSALEWGTEEQKGQYIGNKPLSPTHRGG